MGMFDSLFEKSQAPEMPTLDIDASLQKTADWNNKQTTEWMKSSPELNTYMQNEFNRLSPTVQSSMDTNRQMGTQLATQGYTDAMGDFMKFLQSESLAAGAASGMPVGSAFTANLGAGIGAQQLLSNQLQGSNLLNQDAQQQSALAQYFMQPSLGLLSQNSIDQGTMLEAYKYNNQIEQQNTMIQAQNASQQSWFDNMIAQTVGSSISVPFSLHQNANAVTSNAPAMAAGMFGSMFGSMGGI
ncbi:MAG: hypothetical protein LBK60_03365 [Verrucomicrobiales bacterium]|jgi:hypothetical protein|nr:hypothetical protein [Verrucomicrobiales bacterium]